MPLRALLTTVAVAALACATGSRASIGVVLVTLDTTRADRLSPYGFAAAPMPAFDRLAREGIVFDQATTVAPLTLPAHTSLFTGLLPTRHGVRDNASAPLGEEQLTLAEILEAHGYRTAGFVGSVVLDPDRGLRQGFQEYGSVAGSTAQTAAFGRRMQRPGAAVIDDAIRWLAGVANERFFLWTHLYDPHRPYEPVEPFASQHDPYVAEIAYADSQIGRLLDALDARGLTDRVVVLVTADHGESLGEHGELDHGVFLYESVLRVPLIARVPAGRPHRVSDVVRLIDVMPTILDLAGVASPPVDGSSLLDLMRGGRRSELEAYAESVYPRRYGWAPLFSLRSGRFKFIDAPEPELYDLQVDPSEARNIFHERQKLAAAMHARLQTERKREAATPGDAVTHDDELQARLGALGYIARGAPRMWETRTDLPDAKTCGGVFEAGRCR
jgi:arylsulfatase A-like enzyme